MSHDILKRLGLDHLDVSSPDFLETLNRMQREARASLPSKEAANSEEPLPFDPNEPLPGLE